MWLTKKTLLLVGFAVLLISALMAACYLSSRRSAQVEEKFESGGGGGETKVEYYAMPGCPHCKAFDPTWKAVAGEVESSDSNTSLSLHRWDINTPEGKEAAKEAGVTAYPHVQKTKPDGTVEVFTGKRTEEALMDFVTNDS
jgi:hypothetical protein